MCIVIRVCCHTCKAVVLCLGILQSTGPSSRLLLKMEPMSSIKYSRFGPPSSTADSPKNVTRKCFLSSHPNYRADSVFPDVPSSNSYSVCHVLVLIQHLFPMPFNYICKCELLPAVNNTHIQTKSTACGVHMRSAQTTCTHPRTPTHQQKHPNCS